MGQPRPLPERHDLNLGAEDCGSGSTDKDTCTCGEGFYKLDPGSGSTKAFCLACGPGTHKNYTSDVSALTCDPCQPGNYSKIGGVNCDMCPPGHFIPFPGSSSCVACGTGKFLEQ